MLIRCHTHGDERRTNGHENIAAPVARLATRNGGGHLESRDPGQAPAANAADVVRLKEEEKTLQQVDETAGTESKRQARQGRLTAGGGVDHGAPASALGASESGQSLTPSRGTVPVSSSGARVSPSMESR